MKSGLSNVQHDLLIRGIDQLALQIEPAGLGAIELHLSMVQKWRSKINLISITNERDLITHHALDSLALLPFVERSQQVLDFGTGAGFPGMLLAAARPGITFSLLDSRRRRIEFLRLVNTQTGLENTSFISARVEDMLLVNDSEEFGHSGVHVQTKFDTLVVRAVASLGHLVSMTAALRYTGQRLIAMKGQYPQEELETLDRKYSDQISAVRVEPLEVPFLDAERHVVIIEYR